MDRENFGHTLTGKGEPGPSAAVSLPNTGADGEGVDHLSDLGLGAVQVLEDPHGRENETTALQASHDRSFVAKILVRTSVFKALSHVGAIQVRSASTVGRGVLLMAAVLRFTITDGLSLQLPFGEVILQAWALLKVTALPAALMAIPFGAMVAIQVSGLVNEVGANTLVGAATGVGVLRQGAPVTAGLLMGGAAAAAVTSDFGARKIREELDALRALGIDPVRRLVVPRFLALVLISPILCVVVIAMGVGAAFAIASGVNGVAPGSFWLSFGSFTKMVDLWFTIGKVMIFGSIVAVISSQRGMEAEGGPRGVADAVNAAVVLNVLCIVAVNLAITQLQTMFFPMAVA